MLWVFLAFFVLPFSLVVGKSISANNLNSTSERVAKSGCSTACAFPFTYMGATYNGCTSDDHDRPWSPGVFMVPTPWCATARDSDGEVTTRVNCDEDCPSSGTYNHCCSLCPVK